MNEQNKVYVSLIRNYDYEEKEFSVESAVHGYGYPVECRLFVVRK